MAIVSVQPLFEGRRGSADFNLNRRFSRVYEVYTDDPTDDVVTAGTLPGSLPVMGDPHDEDPDVVVTNREVEQDSADPLRWLVTIEYSSQPGGAQTPPAPAETLQPDTSSLPTSGGDPGNLGSGSGVGGQGAGDRPENPLDRPPVWQVTFQTTQEALVSAYARDQDGNNIGGSVPVVNSAGFKFDPPIMIEVSRPVIRVTKNYGNFFTAGAAEMQDSVNKYEFGGYQPRQLRCVGIEANSNVENGVQFWSITFSFAVKYDTWDIRVLDCGLWQKAVGWDAQGPFEDGVEPIRDKHGELVTEPVPLKDGFAKKPSDPEDYLIFSAYKQRDYAAMLGL